MGIQCSGCKAEMEEIELEGVLIDQCGRCGGVWLDAGEDETLAAKKKLTPAEEMRKKKLDLLRQWKVVASAARVTDRECPRCNKHMHRSNYKDIPGLQVDRCPADCGLYLDKGELSKVRLVKD